MNQTLSNWERFYTDTKGQNGEEELVDQISIDVVNKVYVLCQGFSDEITDGEDEFGNEICSIYVSREIFDILLQGIKEKGYNQARIEE